jgi:hypothetical protein
MQFAPVQWHYLLAGKSLCRTYCMILLAELFGGGSGQSCGNVLHDIETWQEIKHQ